MKCCLHVNAVPFGAGRPVWTECGKPVYGNGYCRAHWQSWRHGRKLFVSGKARRRLPLFNVALAKRHLLEIRKGVAT